MFGVCSSSAKTYVFGALVACTTRSEAARGDVADLLRARKGSSALSALVCSILTSSGSEGVELSLERGDSKLVVLMM